MTPAEEQAVREGAARIAAAGGETVDEFARKLQRLGRCGASVADRVHLEHA